MPALDPSQWSSLGGLMFVARRLVEGLWAGRHASPRRGHGLEFHDYRSYSPGDATSDIDWKVFGRTDRLYLKRYLQQTDLNVHILVDVSASMDFAGLDHRGVAIKGKDQPTKLRYAQLLAAALSFLIIRQGDRAGLGLYTDTIRQHLPPAGTWAHLMRLCSALEETQADAVLGDSESTTGQTGTALRQSHALLRHGRGGARSRGLVVLISDLLDPPEPMLDGLDLLRHDQFDVILFGILTQQELDLAGMNDLRLLMVDAETHQRVGTDIGAVRRQYSQLMAEHLAQLSRACAARNIDYNLLTTDQPVIEALRRYLVRRSVMGR
jgi:uncharacterized protein (DUF58 family)